MKERTRLGIFSGGFGNILEEQWQVDVQLKAKKKKKKSSISPNTWILS